MADDTSNDLSKRLGALISTANQRTVDQTRLTEEQAHEQQLRFVMFNELAVTYLKDEIGPRLNQLASYFPNASVAFVDVVGTHGAICRFKHSIRFPATVEVRFCCARDEHVRQFICSYDLDILPVYIKFEKHDQIASPLDSPDRPDLCKWLDDKIVQFLETYLKLEFSEQYQRENQVTDPVSNFPFNRAIAVAETIHKGHTFYFLSEDNRKVFEASPESYTVP